MPGVHLIQSRAVAPKPIWHHLYLLQMVNRWEQEVIQYFALPTRQLARLLAKYLHKWQHQYQLRLLEPQVSDCLVQNFDTHQRHRNLAGGA